MMHPHELKGGGGEFPTGVNGPAPNWEWGKSQQPQQSHSQASFLLPFSQMFCSFQIASKDGVKWGVQRDEVFLRPGASPECSR